MLRKTRCDRRWTLLLAFLTLVLPRGGFAQDGSATKADRRKEAPPVEAKKVKSIVPVFHLSQQVLESPVAEDPFLGNLGAEPLKDLVARIAKAQDDERVKAIVVTLDGASMGLAQREELYAAIVDFRKSGKPVYAYADYLGFADLALLSSASRVSVAPTGHLFIHGLYGAQPHLRGLLDEIRVTPDFLTCGAYKSAGETYMRKQPSRQAEEMYDWLFDSLYDTCIDMIARGRNASKAQSTYVGRYGLVLIGKGR